MKLIRIKLSQGESVGSNSYCFCSAKARYSNTDALQGIVHHFPAASGNGNFSSLTFDKLFDLHRIFQVEGRRCQASELASIRSDIRTVKLLYKCWQKERPGGRNAPANHTQTIDQGEDICYCVSGYFAQP